MYEATVKSTETSKTVKYNNKREDCYAGLWRIPKLEVQVKFCQDKPSIHDENVSRMFINYSVYA